MTTSALLTVIESARLRALRHTALGLPPALWLAGILLDPAAVEAATLVGGLAVFAAALLLSDGMRRLDPAGCTFVVTDSSAASGSDNGIVAAVECKGDSGAARGGLSCLRQAEVVVDFRSALWLVIASSHDCAATEEAEGEPLLAPPTRRPVSRAREPAVEGFLLLSRDAIDDATWRRLRQRLALGSSLWLVPASGRPGLSSTVSLPSGSLSG